MFVIEPHITDLRVHPGCSLFRGLSRREREALKARHSLVLRPRDRVADDAELEALLNPIFSALHVLESDRRYLSLSLSVQTAIYYATTAGQHDGVLAVAKFPSRGVVATRTGGDGPSVWSSPTSTLLDPRQVMLTGRLGLDDWIEARARSRTDQELLLVRGSLPSVRFFNVKPSDWDGVTRPWSTWGYSTWTADHVPRSTCAATANRRIFAAHNAR